MWMSWKRRKELWEIRGDMSFKFAGGLLALGEPAMALAFARAGWCYAHHLPVIGEWLYWWAKEGLEAGHWRDLAMMSRYHRIDREKGLRLVGMAK